jgi:hypothetical protein
MVVSDDRDLRQSCMNKKRLWPFGDTEDVGKKLRLFADEVANDLPLLDRKCDVADVLSFVDAVKQAGDQGAGRSQSLSSNIHCNDEVDVTSNII